MYKVGDILICNKKLLSKFNNDIIAANIGDVFTITSIYDKTCIIKCHRLNKIRYIINGYLEEYFETISKRRKRIIKEIS